MLTKNCFLTILLVVTLSFQSFVTLAWSESETWFSYSTGLPENITINCIAKDKAQSNNLFLGTSDGVFSSNDNGETWVDLSQGLLSKDIQTLRWEESVATMFAGTSQSGVFKYLPLAHKWISYNSNLPAKSIQCLKSSNQYMYAGSKSDGLYRVKIGSEKWTDLNFDDKNPILKKCEFRDILVWDENTIFCATNKGLLSTEDGGENWRLHEDSQITAASLTSITLDPQNTNHLVAGSQTKGILESMDRGKTWQPILVDTGKGNAKFIQNVLFHPKNPKTMYTASKDYGVFQSVDSGNSWIPLSSGLENITIQTIALFQIFMTWTPLAGSIQKGFYEYLDAKPPAKPTSLVATVKNKAVYLSWEKAMVGSFPIAGYNIYRSKTDSIETLEKISSSEKSEFLDEKVAWNEKFFYAVSAFDLSKPTHESNYSSLVPILVDDLPQIKITNPTNNEIIEEESIVIKGSITDQGSGIADSMITVFSTDLSKEELYPLTLDADGYFLQTVALSIGKNQILIKAIDQNKNVSEETIEVIRKMKEPDKVPPEILLSQPKEGFIVEEAFISVSGTILDKESGVFEAKIWNEYKGSRLGQRILSLNTDGFFMEKLPVFEGQNTIVIQAIDSIGNMAEKRILGLAQKPDLDPPTLMIIEPVDRFSTEEPSIKLYGKTSDEGSGLDTVTVVLEFMGKVMYEKNLTVDSNGFFTEQLNIMEGENKLTITAKDKRDNQTKKAVTGNRKPKPIEILVTLQIGSNKAFINDQEIILKAPPEIKSSRTFVPVRFIAEAFGANVNWVPARKEIQITWKDIYITLWLNQSIVTIESLSDYTKIPVTKFLDVAPYLSNGSTLVPLRFIVDSWQAQIEWQKETQKILIRLKSN